jgi:pilus assembly protein CpaF
VALPKKPGLFSNNNPAKPEVTPEPNVRPLPTAPTTTPSPNANTDLELDFDFDFKTPVSKEPESPAPTVESTNSGVDSFDDISDDFLFTPEIDIELPSISESDAKYREVSPVTEESDKLSAAATAAEAVAKAAVEKSNLYQPIGELTADDVITVPFSRYAHLQEKIKDTTGWIQDTLQEKGLSDAVGEARRTRDHRYLDMVREIDRLILRKINTEGGIAREDTKVFIASVVNEILGFGPIEPLWQDPEISEIMVNGPYDIRVEIKGKPMRALGVRFRDPEHLLGISQQMLGLIGRRIDVQNPKEDGQLPDGSRVNIVHTELAPSGPIVTIRRFPDTVFSVKKLVELKSMTEDMAVEIGNLVYMGNSIIIVGGTGTGKTSFLNAVSGCIPDTDRIITVEDTLELRLNPNKHVVALQARPASSAGTGGVSIRDLVKTTLRMRPDRVIVGEVRDSSAYDMLQAMNTGHEGSLTTVHANNAEGAVERIALLVSEAGEIGPDRALSLIAGGVDLFVVIERYEDGSRRVKGIYEVPSHLTIEGNKLSLTPIPLFEFVHDNTDEDGTVIGHYEKMNDISDSLIRKHRIDKKHRLTLEEIYNISDVEIPGA